MRAGTYPGVTLPNRRQRNRRAGLLDGYELRMASELEVRDLARERKADGDDIEFSA